jgi:hypothetical protein
VRLPIRRINILHFFGVGSVKQAEVWDGRRLDEELLYLQLSDSTRPYFLSASRA